MTLVHNFLSWLDTALLLSMCLIWTGNRLKLGVVPQRIGIAAAAIAGLVPVSGLSLFMYSGALIGDLSMTSKMFLIAWLLYRLGGPVLTDMKEIRFVLAAVAVVGLLFYPLALGLTPFDPYSAGFSASILVVWVVIAAAYGSREGFSMLAAAMLAALWGYLLGIMQSDNLFDYLFDPLLFLYAVGFTCVTLLRNQKAGKGADRTQAKA